jgi:tRNA 2-selenouridine synthase
VLVHCWRGGMRSAGVAWLLDLYGFKVYALVGGYKFFRRWVLEQFEEKWSLKIIGGYTGSGKTELIKQLSEQGQLVVDLEALAHHKGSAFGNIGMPAQPSQEMFENLLAYQLHNITSVSRLALNVHESADDLRGGIWMEDESQRIGTVNIPQSFWMQMRQSRIFFLDIPFSERLAHIVEEYGGLDREKMIAAVERIQKRLGGLETKMCIEFLMEGETVEAFRILLKYYDKWYLKGLNNRTDINHICYSLPLASVDPRKNARAVNDFIDSLASLKNVIDERRNR